MGFFDRLFRKEPAQDATPGAPFMEHPAGEYTSAVDAMADAIVRLRALPDWSEWITFCLQGMANDDDDTDHHAEIRMRRDEIQVDAPIDADAVTRRAGVTPSSLTPAGANYSVAHASPADAARIMDAIFRQYLGIRPHPEEGDDYAIGAEW